MQNDTAPCVLEVPKEFDLIQVIEAVKDNSISETTLVYILVDNGVDHFGLIDVLIEHFGLKRAKRIMMHALRYAKKQKREIRLKTRPPAIEAGND